MKRIFISLIAITVLAFVSVEASAQCKNFAKKSKVDLLPFIHDGIYNATVLAEGESAELYKTFYSGQEYRIMVVADEGVPPVDFQIMDSKRKVLYNSKDNNGAKKWDFILESSQQLIISLQVQTSENVKDDISKGCVAVLIGFMNEENKLR